MLASYTHNVERQSLSQKIKHSLIEMFLSDCCVSLLLLASKKTLVVLNPVISRPHRLLKKLRDFRFQGVIP